MNKKNGYQKFIYIVLLFGITSIIISGANTFIAFLNDRLNNKYISWIPSILILISAYIIRFKIIDLKKIENILSGSNNPLLNKSLNVKRYVNYILVSMNIGLISTVVIYYNFFIGSVLYLLMHVSIIISFSGIINLSLKAIYIDKKLFIKYLLNIIFWICFVPVIFFCVTYKNILSLIYLPYAYILGSMTAISFFGLFYKDRPLNFRLILVSAALLFLVSDTLIGYAGRVMGKTSLLYLINPTYVISIFLFAFSPLVINSRKS